MNDVDTLTLRAFIFTLYQLPTISPELQTALQKLLSAPQGMLSGLKDIIDQEPLATTYMKNYALLQSREGKRSKGLKPKLTDDTEDSNALVEAIETQTGDAMKKVVEEICQTPDANLKNIINSYLNIDLNNISYPC